MATLRITVRKRELAERVGHFVSFCRRVGLPITPQRLAIYKQLASVRTHPDAQEIYGQLRAAFPSMSLATVYKNLDVLEKLRLIKKVAVIKGKARYDADLDEHHHLIDEDNGKIVDLLANDSYRPRLPKDLAQKFAVQQASVTFSVRRR